MISALAKLSSGERRFVVGVAAVLFIVINIFWVWPHFSDFGDLRDRGQAAEIKMVSYRGVIQQADRLRPELNRMQVEGAAVPAEEQVTEFFRTVNSQAMQSGVQFLSGSRTSTRTNQFFIEQVQTVTVQATEKQLVDFLYNLGSGGSLIRARSLSVHPDASRMQLNATITLIASYQKNSKAPGPAAAPKAAAPAKPRPLPGAQPAPAGNPAPAQTGTQKKK